MVIDFHVHMFPDRLAKRAVAELAQRAGIAPNGEADTNSVLQRMRQAGVCTAVIQNIATNAKQTKNVNLFAVETNKREEFVAFGSVHPDCDWEYELDFLSDNGIRGIKLHPDYQSFYVDDPKMQKIYEGILKRGFVLLFHSGIDAGLPEPVHCTPMRAAKTLGLFRGEKVVFAHSGGFEMWKEAEQYLIGEDIYIDTSVTYGYLPKEERERLYRLHDSRKILFATDFPWGDFEQEANAIRALDMDEEWKEMVLHKDAEELLGIK